MNGVDKDMAKVFGKDWRYELWEIFGVTKEQLMIDARPKAEELVSMLASPINQVEIRNESTRIYN